MMKIVIENRSSLSDAGAVARVSMYIGACRKEALTDLNGNRILDIECKCEDDKRIFIVRDVNL